MWVWTCAPRRDLRGGAADQPPYLRIGSPAPTARRANLWPRGMAAAQLDRSCRPPRRARRGEVAQGYRHVVARGDAVAGRQGRGGSAVHEIGWKTGCYEADEASYCCRTPVSDVLEQAVPDEARYENSPSSHAQEARTEPRVQPRSRRRPLPSSSVERKHTINDIARLANVSKKTVSRVINESPFVREETRARITEIIKRVGLHARSAGARARVSPLVPDRPDLRQPQCAVCHQHPGRRAGGAAPHGLRAGRASVRSQQRGIPDRHPSLHQRGRSWTASCCCRRSRRIRRSRRCCGSWNARTSA